MSARCAGAGVQVLSEVVYVHGTRMVAAGLQLSNVSKPLRNKTRSMFRGKAPIMRKDLRAMDGLYFAPRSTVQQQLAYCAPHRWPELIEGLATLDAGAPPDLDVRALVAVCATLEAFHKHLYMRCERSCNSPTCSSSAVMFDALHRVHLTGTSCRG